MVRLKAQPKIKGFDCGDEFQFHNGSIKSIKGIMLEAKIAKFQFHNGSIKRLVKKRALWCFRLSFNSTMVRLKAE